MSLNRVSAIETLTFAPGDEGSRRGSESSFRARKLSFNPLPESWEPPEAVRDETIHAIGAFEVPKWKRVLQVIVTVLYCLVAAGIIFGYAAIKPVLKREGAYEDVCRHGSGDVGQDTCIEIRLNLMFTVAAVGTNVAALPIGAILDYYGPRVCGLMGSFFLTAGALLLAYAKRMPFDGFLVGYLCLALGGPFTYISSFHLSNAFPRNSGFILALLTGAFDASSALFLIYRLIYQGTDGAFGHHKFFLAYLVVPVTIAILQLTILPKQSYKTVGELIEEIEEPLPDPAPYDAVDENTALLQDEQRQHRASIVEQVQELVGSTKAIKQAKREERKNEISGVWGVMHNNTALEQIRSPWFILICAFTVIQMTRINYFVATIRPQYIAMLHNTQKAIQVNDFFDIALPLGGLISIPFIGVFLDNNSTVRVLTTLVSVATTIGILGVIPEMWAAYANVVMFCLYRPFYYTSVSDYSAKVFGFRTFGKVYGLIICLSGLFNFSQSGLDYLFHKTFRNNPIPVNIMLLSIGAAIGIALITFVAVRVRGIKRNLLEQEAETSFRTPEY